LRALAKGAARSLGFEHGASRIRCARASFCRSRRSLPLAVQFLYNVGTGHVRLNRELERLLNHKDTKDKQSLDQQSLNLVLLVTWWLES
jgi:hypothetical protein